MESVLDRFESDWDVWSLSGASASDAALVQKVLQIVLNDVRLQILPVSTMGLGIYATTPIEKYGRVVQGEGESPFLAARSLCSQIDVLADSLYARFNEVCPPDATTAGIEWHLNSVLGDRGRVEVHIDPQGGKWSARKRHICGQGSSPLEAARDFLLKLEVMEGLRNEPKTRFEHLLEDETV